MDFKNESTATIVNSTGNEFCKTQEAFGEHYQQFEYVINVYITVALIMFGIIGNVISFVILKYMKQATVTLLLRALAAADSLYLLTCLNFGTFRTLFVYSEYFSQVFWFYPYLFIWTWPVASMAQTASVWLVVLVTIDRYEAICHVMATARFMTKSKVKVYVCLVFVGSICFNLPTAFDLRVVDRRRSCPNIKKIDWYPTKFYQDPLYDLVYKTILSIAFRAALPVFIVIVLNMWMLCKIKKSEEYRAGMGQRTSIEFRSINIMIAIITLVYVLCEMPDLVFRILRVITFYMPDSVMSWDKFAYFAQISNFFLTINSSTNFIWYCVAGTKFRETLKWRVCGERSRGSISSTMVMLSTCRTTSSTPTSPGKPLIVADRPLSLPGTPLIRASGNKLSFPVSSSLATQRTLSGYLKPSANGSNVSASTTIMSSTSLDILINTSGRSSMSSTPKLASAPVRFL